MTSSYSASLFLSHILFLKIQNKLASKTDKCNKYKHSPTLTGMKIKERRHYFSSFPKRDEFVSQWNSQCESGDVMHACTCVSAVCSDQIHWCVIGSPLSRWHLWLECLSHRRTGGGRADDNVPQTETHSHTNCKYFMLMTQERWKITASHKPGLASPC